MDSSRRTQVRRNQKVAILVICGIYAFCGVYVFMLLVYALGKHHPWGDLAVVVGALLMFRVYVRDIQKNTPGHGDRGC